MGLHGIDQLTTPPTLTTKVSAFLARYRFNFELNTLAKDSPRGIYELSGSMASVALSPRILGGRWGNRWLHGALVARCRPLLGHSQVTLTHPDDR